MGRECYGWSMRSKPLSRLRNKGDGSAIPHRFCARLDLPPLFERYQLPTDSSDEAGILNQGPRPADQKIWRGRHRNGFQGVAFHINNSSRLCARMVGFLRLLRFAAFRCHPGSDERILPICPIHRNFFQPDSGGTSAASVWQDRAARQKR
jgi:hypothetical protein